MQALEREINDLNTQIEKTQRALDFDQVELADVEKEMDGAGEVIADLETQKAEAVQKHSNAVANGAAIVKQLFLEEQVTRAVKDLANQQELLARTQDEERVPLQKKIEGLQVSERLSLRSFPFHFSCRALQSYSPRLILFFSGFVARFPFLPSQAALQDFRRRHDEAQHRLFDMQNEMAVVPEVRASSHTRTREPRACSRLAIASAAMVSTIC